jgi:hypothetical protein
MSLLTIIQNSCDRLGLVRPSVVVASSGQTERTLLGLAQEEGKTLAKRYDWQVITEEHTFSTANGTSSYSIPSDFDRIVKNTVFNRTRNRRMLGDLTAEQWQEIQSSLSTRVDPAFRFRGGAFLISPTPSAIETVAYEYVSKNWCESSGGTDQSAWAADTDVAFLDEELITLGIVWRFKSKNGFDYAEAKENYEIEVNNAILRDGARTRIDTTACASDRAPKAQVPETLTGLT